MKLQNTLVLVAVFAALAGYVYFVEMPKPANDTSVESKEKYVFTLAAEDVENLQIKDGDNSVFLAKDASGHWWVGGVGSAGGAVDEYRLTDVLASLTDLRASRIITDTSAGLAVYGLEKPTAEANMLLAGDVTESLLVGDKTPQGSAYYAQKKGTTPIYLVPEYLVSDLRRLVSEPPYAPTPTAVPTVGIPLTPTVPLTSTTK
jgi:hypothetical protein